MILVAVVIIVLWIECVCKSLDPEDRAITIFDVNFLSTRTDESRNSITCQYSLFFQENQQLFRYREKDTKKEENKCE